MTLTTAVEQVATLDDDKFTRPARWAAQQLAERGHAYVVLAPGDATAYRIMVIAPGPEFHEGGLMNQARYYHIALSMGLGLGYEWMPEMSCEPDYVHSKWTHGREGSDYWTAAVMSRFLKALSAAITAKEA